MATTQNPSSSNAVDTAILIKDDVRESLPDFTHDLYKSMSNKMKLAKRQNQKLRLRVLELSNQLRVGANFHTVVSSINFNRN